MYRKISVSFCLLLLFKSAMHAGAPNIVLILADDMGYGDLRSFNEASQINTSNIDALAAAGMRFTDAHAPAAVCIPTRYGLLTGRYPHRADLKLDKPVLEADRQTLPMMLRDVGYKTACFGKWHLGFDNLTSSRYAYDYQRRFGGGPCDRGFDSYWGLHASLDIPPYFYIQDDRAVTNPTRHVEASVSDGWSPIQGAFWRAGMMAPGFDHDAVLGNIFQHATHFIDRQAQRAEGQIASESPFFLYVALTGPHTPWLPPKEFKGQSEASMYGDFVLQVDDGVGQIADALQRNGLADNTIFIFTSDNGPVWYQEDVERFGHRSTHHFRGMKGDAWEGGHRVPLIVRWPQRVAADSISNQLVCHTDFFETLRAIVDAPAKQTDQRDSHDFSAILLDRTTDQQHRDTFVMRSSGGIFSARQGNWKLIQGLGSGGFSKPRRVEPTDDGPQGQLYDLNADPSESNNLWSKHPEKVEKLTMLLQNQK